VDLRKVKKLIELAEESDIAEIEVTSGDESVRILMKGSGQPRQSVPQPAAVPEPETTVSAAPMVTAGKRIVSPMAGTFYRAPSPEAPPYVEQGQEISAGDVVCIVESMKMMHEIRAVEGGTIAAVMLENGTPIGTGEVLFTLS
jgi:acetyl-CoA carboxylase biotin carboxyl carrier protein